MNVSNLVFHAIADVAQSVQPAPPVTVDDICALIHQGRHTRRALNIGFDIPPETEINRALRRIDHKIEVQKHHRQRASQGKSHGYDNNALIALVQCRQALNLGLLIRSPR